MPETDGEKPIPRPRKVLPRPAHFGDLDLQAKLDFRQHGVEAFVAGGVAEVGRAMADSPRRLSPFESVRDSTAPNCQGAPTRKLDGLPDEGELRRVHSAHAARRWPTTSFVVVTIIPSQ
jgi:hypothetical protein